MDNLALTLLGVALALGRLGRGLPRRTAIVVGVVAANLPDADLVLFLVRGQTEFVFRHATVTHSVFALLALPLLVAGAARLVSKAGFVSLWLLAGAAVAGHLALDATGAWGIAPLAPLSAVRVGLGWTYSTDFVIWGLLTLPLWAPRVAGVPADRVATMALAAVVLWVGTLGGLHGLALGRARDAAQAAGVPASDVQVFASPFLPVFWNGLARDEDHVVQLRVSLIGESRVESVHPRNLRHAAVEAVLATDVGARWLAWARVPVAEVVCLKDASDTPGRVAVRLSDRRFADPWVERPVGTLRFELEFERRPRPYRVLSHAWATPWSGEGDPEAGVCTDAPITARAAAQR